MKDSEYDKRAISGNEIINYAVELLEESDDDNVVSLAISAAECEGDILEALIKLSEKEESDYGFEFRKFRAMYIYNSMPSMDDDYINGILKLNETWNKFEFPVDSSILC